MNESLNFFIHATRDPGRYDDISKGCIKGQIWVNDNKKCTFRCEENKIGFAKWICVK